MFKLCRVADNCESLLKNESKDMKQQKFFTANNKQYTVIDYNCSLMHTYQSSYQTTTFPTLYSQNKLPPTHTYFIKVSYA